MKQLIIAIAALAVVPVTGLAGPDDDYLENKETSLAELAGDFTDMQALISDRKRNLTKLEQEILKKDLVRDKRHKAPKAESCVAEQQELELADKEVIVTPAW